MKVKEMFFLWGRNIKGVLSAKRQVENDVPLGLLWFATLPLTLTLGAVIQTLIDIFSRKELPKTEMVKMGDALNNINDESNEMDGIVNELLAYSPKSNSSRDMKNKLYILSNDANNTMNQSVLTEKMRLQKDQLETDMGEGFATLKNLGVNALTTAVSSVKLNEANQKKLDQYSQEEQVKVNRSIHPLEKQVILGFIKEDKNSGKMSEHIIYNKLFPSAIPAEPKPIEIPDYKESPLNK